MENTKKTPPVRPVTVRVGQLKNDIQTAVLKSELPPFMIEMILGEYLAKTYLETKHRPIYLLKESSEEDYEERSRRRKDEKNTDR